MLFKVLNRFYDTNLALYHLRYREKADLAKKATKSVKFYRNSY